MQLHERHYVIVKKDSKGSYREAETIAQQVSLVTQTHVVCYDWSTQPGDRIGQFVCNSATVCTALSEQLRKFGYERIEIGNETVDADDIKP